MKKAIFALLTFLQLSVMAYAGENTSQGPYVGGLVGVNFMNEKHLDFYPGFKLGAFAGYKFSSCENPLLNMRLEGEISYRHNAVRKVKFHSQKARIHGYTDSVNYMVNAYYDIETETKWTPYVGVGLGWVHTKEHAKFHVGNGVSIRGSQSDNRFASQYIGGLAYEIADGVQLGGEYRYVVVSKHANEHTIALTLKRYF
jgi:outer membrane autotransporter protein